MKLLLPALVAVVALISGCMRTNTETVVAEDGAWTRTVKFTIPKEDMMGEPAKFDKLIELPKAPEWETSQATEKENLVFTGTRKANLGETITDDLRIKQKEKVALSNTVTVRDLGNGRFEYIETITYIGEKTTGMKGSRDELHTMLRESLGDVTVTEAQMTAITDGAMVDLWRIIFGPTRPLMPTLAMHPDLGERELRRAFGKTMDAQFEKQLATQMDKDARLKAIRTLMTKMDSEKIMGPTREETESSGGGGGNDGLVSMTTVVKLPGRIIEANGEIDEVAGEVFWAFYSESPVVGPLVLRAVCEVKP